MGGARVGSQQAGAAVVLRLHGQRRSSVRVRGGRERQGAIRRHRWSRAEQGRIVGRDEESNDLCRLVGRPRADACRPADERLRAGILDHGLIAAAEERRGDVGNVAPEIGRRVDLAVGEIVELVALADDRRSQYHRNRADHHIRAGTDELEIEAVRAAVPDKLDVEVRRLAGAHPGERAGVVDDANARIGSADGEVHRDVRDGVLDRRGDPAGDRRPEAGGDLEVERIARIDRVDRSVGDRRRGAIDRPGQLRQGLEPLSGGGQ